MTELYRGLLEILVMRCVEQIESIRVHLRSHNSGYSQDYEFDIGVTGFWNLMLETVFTIFIILFLFSAVCLTATLAVASYPFAALMNYAAWLGKNTRGPSDESPIIIKQNDGKKEKK